METSNPAPLVNAEVLKKYTGRRVRCVLKVLWQERNAGFAGLSSDGVQISVKQASIMAPLSQFVEVIRIVGADRSFRAEICTNFGYNFDIASSNQFVQMANSEHQPLFM